MKIALVSLALLASSNAYAQKVTCTLDNRENTTSAWVDLEAGTSGGDGGGDGQYGISTYVGDLSFSMEVFEEAEELLVSVTLDSGKLEDEWRQITVKANSSKRFTGPDRKSYLLKCFH